MFFLGKSFLYTAISTLAFFAAPTVYAHDAPSGWKYPYSCCSGIDCRPVKTKAISVRPDGYVILTTGELLHYDDRRIRYSPDGEYHWCSKDGKEDTATICLFVPPRSF